MLNAKLPSSPSRHTLVQKSFDGFDLQFPAGGILGVLEVVVSIDPGPFLVGSVSCADTRDPRNPASCLLETTSFKV